jgi:hypothetical protein
MRSLKLRGERRQGTAVWLTGQECFALDLVIARPQAVAIYRQSIVSRAQPWIAALRSQ